MRNRRSSGLAWFGPVVALSAAALVAGSPRLRYELQSVLGQAAEVALRGVGDLRTRMRNRFGKHMEALEEIRGSIDSATTQWESSMTVSKVASALAEDSKLRDQRVGVRMIGGILHLEGDVRSEEDRDLAATIACRASGAELVANDLRIAPPVR